MKAGEQLHARDYTVEIPWRPVAFSGSPDVERIAAEFDRGATIVVQALHHHWAPLAEFCRHLEIVIGHPVQANSYYTPSSSQGLAVHHDTHDVFVLQVEGEKRWLVYEPVLELPLRDQRYSPELGPPGNPVEDVTLAPGDTLYFPRGWLHEALTSETDSLHLTIGINVYTWLESFRAALEQCADELGFRRSVPPDGELDPELLERLRARLGPDDVRRRMRERFVRTRRPVLPDQLSQVRAARGIGPTTAVERRATVIAELRPQAETVSLLFHGKEVRLPAHAQDAVEFIVSASEPFTAAGLPGSLDIDGRLVLLRRLVREGLLVVSRPPGFDDSSPRTDGGAAA